MHVLLTTDTCGGVWTFTAELASALAQRGHRVTVAAFGPPPPAPHELQGPGIELISANFALEWMNRSGTAAETAREVEAANLFFSQLAGRLRPDLLHCNQFAFAASPPRLPSLLVVHSDVISWWRAVYQTQPPQNGYQTWYAALARQALARARAVVTPTQTAAGDLRASFQYSGPIEVIANGRWPGRMNPHAEKSDYAVSIGRLWDCGKQPLLLCRNDLDVELFLIGDTHHPTLGPQPLPTVPRLHLTGPLPAARALRVLAGARVYVATSRYEPFGLAPLEAAFSRCALLLNDIPSLREVWGDDAVYFSRNDGPDLARQLRALMHDPAAARAWGQNALARARRLYATPAMADRYLELYHRILDSTPARVPAGAAASSPSCPLPLQPV